MDKMSNRTVMKIKINAGARFPENNDARAVGAEDRSGFSKFVLSFVAVFMKLGLSAFGQEATADFHEPYKRCRLKPDTRHCIGHFSQIG